MSRPPASDLVAACAVRTLARTETFMPMKPAAPDRIAPIANPIATVQESKKPEADEHDDADAGDGRILPLQIGLRPLAHRAGNLLHPLRAGVRRHQAHDRVDAVDDGEEPTDDNQAQKHGEKAP